MNASDIAKTRIENPKDHLKRDQEVWVKVISMAGGRIRLSMRDVNQKTGTDLVPMGKAVEGNQRKIPFYRQSALNNVWCPCWISISRDSLKGE